VGGGGVELTVRALLGAYRSGRLRPSEVAASLAEHDAPVWITRVPRDELLRAAAALDDADPSLPLYGVPFAVKDNIDVAGLPTTAACPGFAHVPRETAPVVQLLLDAGGLLVGKTNMDQFATGLVGTRSPYGACSSVFDAARVSGGSSSGSALAVALGEVAFALGTDTAGSGRVPAAYNELVGVKPTRGLLSTRGVVPACASLDCVSILAHDAADAAAILDVAAGPDPGDPWSRAFAPPVAPRRGVLAVPDAPLHFTEPEARTAWELALVRAAERFTLVPVDVTPLLEAAPLLYAAWVAERTADLAPLLAAEPAGLDPTVAAIIRGGARRSAVDVFDAVHRVAELASSARGIWAGADALLLPTVPGHPTLAQVREDPVGVNEALGRFTNFVNLMDLAALALPGPRRPDGLPGGVTLLAPAFHDHRLLALGAAWGGEHAEIAEPGGVRLAVVGAHMSGLALNGQLTDRGARRIAATRTAADYRLFALPGGTRPGLVRVAQDGASVEAEVWELAAAALGELLTEVPAPLALGRVELEDGEEVVGFVCEAAGAAGARDITALGGWRAYLALDRMAVEDRPGGRV
jgi:allophanate hydrolase